MKVGIAIPVATVLVALARAGDAARPASQPATSPAADAAKISPETEKRARDLVHKLSAEHWKERDEAEKALVALGPDLEPLLRQLSAETGEPEAAARLKIVLRELGDRRWTGPSLVTLRLTEAPARRVFEEIFRQAGAEFALNPPDLFDDANAGRQPGGLPPLTVDYGKTPFWAALRDACNKAGLNARDVYDRNRLTLTRDGAMPPMQGPAVIEGPVLIVAEAVNLSAGVQFVNPGATRQRGGSFALQVFTEPRMRVTRGFFEAEKMEDDKGEDLLPPAPADPKPTAPRGAPLQQQTGYFAWKVAVPMRLPSGNGTSIKTFRGKLHLFAHTETRRAEVVDVLKAKEQTREVGGKRFIVHEVAPLGNEYNVRMTIFRENVSEEDWAWFRYPFGRVRLLDARGRDLATSSGGGGDDNAKADFVVQFRREAVNAAPEQQPGEPARFVWDLPVKTREVVVPVVFEGLPLP